MYRYCMKIYHLCKKNASYAKIETKKRRYVIIIETQKTLLNKRKIVKKRFNTCKICAKNFAQKISRMYVCTTYKFEKGKGVIICF